MAIEIVDFPIKNGDFPVRYVKLPEGIWWVEVMVIIQLIVTSQLLRILTVDQQIDSLNRYDSHVPHSSFASFWISQQ